MRKTIPTKRRNWLRHGAVRIGMVYDAFHRFLAKVTGSWGKPMTAEVYFAVQHHQGVEVQGRVLLARSWRHPRVEDHPVVNLWQMLKRWATPERPWSLVRISAGGSAVEQRADREGYFDVFLPPEMVTDGELLIEFPESSVSEPVSHSISRTGEKSRCLVISDIDDTVLVTHVARLLEMVATTMFGNALTRQLFPGTVELYQALRRGGSEDGEEWNPLVYVTSSPYNLHGLLQLIFEENGMPPGAFFMTDWGLDYDHWFRVSHHVHKTRSITRALEWHPDKKLILIGDSSQHDTQIYAEAALEHPGKVDLILIRDVSGPERIQKLEAEVEVERLRQVSTEIAFFQDADEAAAILHQRGWINRDQVVQVMLGVREGKRSLLRRLAHPADKPRQQPPES